MIDVKLLAKAMEREGIEVLIVSSFIVAKIGDKVFAVTKRTTNYVTNIRRFAFSDRRIYIDEDNYIEFESYSEMAKFIKQQIIEEFKYEHDKENANVLKSNVSFEKSLVSNILKERYLAMIPPEVKKAHIDGLIHIHDLDFAMTRPNCLQHDIKFIIDNGLKALSCTSRPPKHLSTAINQILKALALSQAHMAGGQGIPLFNIILAPLAKNETYKDIKQAMQHFVYELNQLQASRGLQTIFSSVNVELEIPKFMKDYAEYEEEAFSIAKALFEVLLEKDAEGRPFLFPNTVGIIRDNPDEELLKLLIKTNIETGNGYYANAVKYGKNLVSVMGCIHGRHKITLMLNDKEVTAPIEEFWEHFSKIRQPRRYGASYVIDVRDLDVYIYEQDRFVKLKRLIRNPTDSWIRIRFDNGTVILVTPDHPLPTLDGVKKAEDIETTDICISSYGENLHIMSIIIERTKSIDYSYDVETESGYFSFDGVLSHNCRTWLDDSKTGSIYDVLRTGNLEYVTLNLPWLAKQDKDIEEALDELISYAVQALLVRRNIVWDNFESGMYPFFSNNFDENGNYYNIGNTTMGIGFVGLNEFVKWSDFDGYELIKLLRQKVDELNKLSYYELAKDYGIEYVERDEIPRWSLVASPAESAASRLAKTVKLDYLTNSFHVKESTKMTFIEKLLEEEKYHELCNGGAITHIWNAEIEPDYDVLARVVKDVINKTRVRYFTFSPCYVYCKNCKQLTIGKFGSNCKLCGSSDVEYYSKITGYMQHVENWNEGKLKELSNRYQTN